MGVCKSSLKNLRKNKNVITSQYDSENLPNSYSSILNNNSPSFLFDENNLQQNLKKYNSAQETNKLKNIQYILSEKMAKREDINKKYKISKKILGTGGTSIVYLAEDSSKNIFAIKRIPKDRIEIQKKIILKEAEICLLLNNNNIMKYYEIYEDLNYVSVVMEKGETDLFELIINSPIGYIPEEISIHFLIQIFEVIDYLHSKINIVHCDIKPENFVVKFDKEKNNLPSLKLIDFGNARRKPMNKERLYNFSGTKEYMAPEALENSGFNEKVDEWAAGIIMFNMLTGADPFIGQNDDDSEYRDNIRFKEIKFEYIKNEKLRELNKKLLNRYMAKRISAKEALYEIKEIRKDLVNNNKISENINMKDYESALNDIFSKI